MSRVRHVLGLSGGKDSTAMAVYLRNKYPKLDLEYYFADTGKELEETYSLVHNLEIHLGKKILSLKAAGKSTEEAPFDHFFQMFGGFIPSSNARWCTAKLKLEPFEKFVGDDPVISYVAIRGDEDREGYISHKSNIQTIFPFRRNIWSEDIVSKVLANNNIDFIEELYTKNVTSEKLENILDVVKTPLSFQLPLSQKVNLLLTMGIPEFNKVVFDFLKTTDYPISQLEEFPLIENEEVVTLPDVINILQDSGIGLPKYFDKKEFEVNGEKGTYFRSRSGCFFCFFQQKIEWVWLYENHPDKFQAAMEYEKDGYTWMQNERLSDLIKPERIIEIKEQHLKKYKAQTTKKSSYLLDVLEEDREGCAICFI